MLLNLCTIILPFLLSCTNRRCANLPRMSVRAYGSIKRKRKKTYVSPTHRVGTEPPLPNLGTCSLLLFVVCRNPAYSGSTAYADLGNIYSLY